MVTLGAQGSRQLAASMAAHEAATPAGVKRIRLAIGTSFGREAGAGMRASRARTAAGWLVGGGREPSLSHALGNVHEYAPKVVYNTHVSAVDFDNVDFVTL